MKSNVVSTVALLAALVMPVMVCAAEPPPPVTPKVIELKSPPSVNGAITAPTIKDNSVVPPAKEVVLPKPAHPPQDTKSTVKPAHVPAKPDAEKKDEE